MREDRVCKRCLGFTKTPELFAPFVYVSLDGAVHDVAAGGTCDVCERRALSIIIVPARGHELYERYGGVLGVCVACNGHVVDLRGGRFVACSVHRVESAL